MQRRRFGQVSSALVGGLLLPVGHAAAAPLAQGIASGAVVKVRGTRHIFVADEAGLLHWGGDSRAISGRFLDWGNTTELTPPVVRSMQRGDPWLSAGLVKDGAPIYLAKWEADQSQPTLQQIQSIGDVEAFGINGNNYGQFVIDVPDWERRYGFSVRSLKKEALDAFEPSVVTPPGTRLRAGDTWRGAGLNLALTKLPYQSWWTGMAADFELQNTSGSVLQLDIPSRVFTLELSTGKRWIGAGVTGVSSDRYKFNDFQPGERRTFTAGFDTSTPATSYQDAILDSRVAWWEVAARDFSPRLSEAYWRESINH